MENYKNTIKKRTVVMIVVCLTVVVVYVVNLFHDFGRLNENFSDYIKGFQLGLIIVLLIFLAGLMRKYFVALKNEQSLKKLFFEETDERAQMISEKTGGNVIIVCAICILIAGIIAGYFNEIIFFTMTGCCLFLLVTRKALKLYYKEKY
jgi:uncharacterized membrane protein